LRGIQHRLVPLLDPLLGGLPGSECALAYRKGVSASKELERSSESAMLITCDISKYYDNITLQHIEDVLVELGFTPLGARLVGRYCVVRNKNGQTLQQGSPASPALSNLVGYFAFDKPILGWLSEHAPSARYVRYCDNLALFFPEDPPRELTETYVAFVRETCTKSGFKTHSWSFVAYNHPKRNQKFIGIVLNHDARVEMRYIDSLRAMLHFTCLNGIDAAMIKYAGLHDVDGGGDRLLRITLICCTDTQKKEFRQKFLRILSGHVQYVGRINEVHGLWLRKLYAAVRTLHGENSMTFFGELYEIPHGPQNKELREAIHRYKRMDESLDAYIDNLKTWMRSISEITISVADIPEAADDTPLLDSIDSVPIYTPHLTENNEVPF
jgi:hypothetical protein